MSSTTERKKINGAKARKINRWKTRIFAKFKTIKAFIDATKTLNYRVFSNWINGWKVPSDEAVEHVESCLKKYGI